MLILFSALMSGPADCSQIAAVRLDDLWRCRSWYASRIGTDWESEAAQWSSPTLESAMQGLSEWRRSGECFLCWDRSQARLVRRFFTDAPVMCMVELPLRSAHHLLWDCARRTGVHLPPENSGALGDLDLMLCILRVTFGRVCDYMAENEKIA